MRHVLKCRRAFIAALALTFLFILGWRGADVTEGLAAIAIGLAAANAGEGAYKRRRPKTVEVVNVDAPE